MNHPKVSIVILNWNGLDDTTECLESLKKVDYPNYEVIVVDNGSRGNDAQVLREKFSDYIQLIENDKNYGLGKAFNIGIKYALENNQPDYVLIMNNDMIVDANFLGELVEAAESNEKIGLAGPKIYYYDHNGRKDVIWSAGGSIRRWSVKITRQIGEDDEDLPCYQAVTNVDWITGAALLIKKQLAEVAGLLDPWYLFNYLDIEYCLRAGRHGFKVVYVPTARVWHKVGVSARKARITYADPSSYYHLIKQCFPPHIYIYHLSLLPALLLRWAFLYMVRHRDIHALSRFVSDFAGFILKKRKQSHWAE